MSDAILRRLEALRCRTEEWGIFDFMVAQEVLWRPIEIVHPSADGPPWAMTALSSLVKAFLPKDSEVPTVPSGVSVFILPTKARTEDSAVPFAEVTHWVPLHLATPLQSKTNAEEYEEQQLQERRSQEEKEPSWLELLAADATIYGGQEAKSWWVSQERERVDRRCAAWARQAVGLRDLGFVACPVDADGACGASTLHIACSEAKLAAQVDKDAVRGKVADAAPRVRFDPRFMLLFRYLEGACADGCRSKMASSPILARSPPPGQPSPVHLPGAAQAMASSPAPARSPPPGQPSPGHLPGAARAPDPALVVAGDLAITLRQEVQGIAASGAMLTVDMVMPRTPRPDGTGKAAERGAGPEASMAVHVTGVSQPLLLTLQIETRALTVRGAAMAAAMLRGSKHYENRPKNLRPGWYWLHVAARDIREVDEAILVRMQPAAPAAPALPRSAVVGVILLGGASQDFSSLRDPWAIGPSCHPVLAAVELPAPVLHVAGNESVWHLAEETRQAAARALARGMYRDFGCFHPNPSAASPPPSKRQRQSSSRPFQMPTQEGRLRIINPPNWRRQQPSCSRSPARGFPGTPPGRRSGFPSPGVHASQGSSPGASLPSPPPPSPDHVDPYIGFAFNSRASNPGRAAEVRDPCQHLVTELLACRTYGEVRQILHPKPDGTDYCYASEGLRNETEAYDTITQWLQEIVGDERSHREVGTSLFSLKRVSPGPFAHCITAIAEREGWFAECLHQEVLLCSSFLEHAESRLFEREGEEHGRAPAIPCFRAASMSARKSSLSAFGFDLLCKNDAAPLDMKSAKWLGMDGTVKGLRDAFGKYHRGGIHSCEVSATYKTIQSDMTETGAHLLNKTKVCTWTHSERDGNLTGQGALGVAGYVFFHGVSGQVEAIEDVLRPRSDGFFKRFDLTISPDDVPHNVGQCCVQSKRLLVAHIAWLYRNAFPNSGPIWYSPQALLLYEAFTLAVADFIKKKKDTLGDWLPYKLRYRDTDVLRYATVAMRMVQSLTSFATNVEDAPPPNRRQIDVVELMYALHRWRRQVHIISAYLRAMEKINSCASIADVSRDLHQQPKAGAGRELEGKDLVAHYILRRIPVAEVTSTKDVRGWMKRLALIKSDLTLQDLATVLRDVATTLEGVGLTKWVDTPVGEKADRRVLWFQKQTWLVLSQSPAALHEARRLLCNEDHFA